MIGRLPLVVATAVLCLLAPTAQAMDGPRNDRFGIFDVSGNRKALAAVEDLGVGWVRVQLPLGANSGERRLRVMSRAVRRLVGMRTGLWLTLYYRVADNIDERGTVGYANTRRGGFPPADMARYRTDISTVVARFAAAFEKVGRNPADWLVVQFGNEVVPRDVAPPDRPVRFWHGTGDQYLAMLDAGHKAVKIIGSDIPVAVAGISSAALDRILEGDRRVGAWYAKMLTKGKYDWADVHLRHRIADTWGKLSWVRRHWSGPVAATEIAGPDPRVSQDIGEAAQARDLTARMAAAIEAGVRRLFWASLVENPSVRDVHRHEGLIDPNPWRLKPSYFAYRELIGRSR